MKQYFSLYDRQTEEKNLINKIGIYILLLKDTIVYVGQSKSLGNRITRHKKGKAGRYKKFDRYGIFLCMEENLLKLESQVMYKYTPLHNISISCNKVCSQQEYLMKKAEKNGK